MVCCLSGVIMSSLFQGKIFFTCKKSNFWLLSPSNDLKSKRESAHKGAGSGSTQKARGDGGPTGIPAVSWGARSTSLNLNITEKKTNGMRFTMAWILAKKCFFSQLLQKWFLIFICVSLVLFFSGWTCTIFFRRSTSHNPHTKRVRVWNWFFQGSTDIHC